MSLPLNNFSEYSFKSKNHIWSSMIRKLDNVFALKQLLRIKFQVQKSPYFESSEIVLNNLQNARTWI